MLLFKTGKMNTGLLDLFSCSIVSLHILEYLAVSDWCAASLKGGERLFMLLILK